MAWRDAQLFWGRIPCRGDVRLVMDEPPAWALQAGTLGPYTPAWSSAGNLFTEPDGSYDPVAAAGLTGCEVHLNAAYWRTLAANDTLSVRAEQVAQFDLLCVEVAHEWGHLFGYGHTGDPRSIMTPGESVRNEPWSCRSIHP